MAYSWVLIPFIAAFIGWFMHWIALQLLFRPYVPKKLPGITLQGLLPKNKAGISRQIAKSASEKLLSFNDIAENISRPESVQKVMPQLEVHIDNFLRVKLPEQMPVIGMFIGDKTIAQLKAVFITELESLFPVVMSTYVNQLQGELDLEKMISEKLQAIPMDQLETMIRAALAREFRVFGWMGAVMGFVTGCVTVLLTLFM